MDENEKILLFNKRFGEILDIPQNILDLQDDKKLREYAVNDLKDPKSFFGVMDYLKVHKNEKVGINLNLMMGEFLIDILHLYYLKVAIIMVGSGISAM